MSAASNLRKLAVLVLLLPLARAAVAQAPPASESALTLASALQTVLARHPLVLAAEQGVTVARGLGEQAAQPPSPTLAYSYSRATREGTVGELLEFPGKRGLRAQAAAFGVQQAEQQLRAVKAALAFQVRQAFYTRLLADRDLDAAQQTLAAVQQIHAAAEQQFQAGDVARLDVVKADVEVAQAQLQVRTAEGKRKVATLSLNLLLGRPQAQPLALSGDLASAAPVAGLEALLEEAYRQSPAYRAARLEQDKQQRDLRLAKLQKFPDLDLSAGYGTEEGVRTPSLAASVSIPLPGRYKGEVEQATGQRLAAVAGVQAAYYQVTEAVVSAYQTWLTAQAQVDTYESRLLAESASVLSDAEKSYRAGETPILSVLDAERTDLQVRQDYAQALYGRQIAVANTILARGGVQ